MTTMPSASHQHTSVDGHARQRPVVQPNAYSGGNGGGSNWTAVSGGLFGTKRENQSNHSFTASVTKIRGSWTHKFGVEARNLLSNYSDLEESAATIAASWFHSGGNFNFEHTTASGASASQNTTNAQKGVNGAAMLLGAPPGGSARAPT